MFIQANHWRDIPTQDWPYPFFTPQELASKGDGSIKINEAALLKLIEVRRAMDCPLIIDSAYRDPLHNARVGGAPLSRHKFGDAFDVNTQGIDQEKLHQIAIEKGFKGFGFYRTFLHMDTYKNRIWRVTL